MPVKLHVDSTWPLNDCVTSNRIRKRRYEDISTRRLRRSDSAIEICDKIASPFRAEWIWDGGFETKQRNCAYRCLQKLRACAARCRRHSDHYLLCAGASKRSKKGLHKSVNAFRGHIDMRSVVLWTNGDKGPRFRGARLRR